MELEPGLAESNITFDHLSENIINAADERRVIELNAELTKLRGKLGFRPSPRGLALNSTRELSVGQLLYIVPQESKFLECTIDHIDERSLTVKLTAGQPPVGIKNGGEVWIHFNRPGDARYAGKCEILKSPSTETGLYITLKHCADLIRNQRRQDFRIDEFRTICLWVVDPALEDAEDPLEILKDRMPERGSLEDISGGGASIILHRNLPVNQGIYINLDPGETYGLPTARATVIRSIRRGRLDRWALSIRFEDLRPSERQKIIKHVFRREREQVQVTT
jgi:c-di-GMP-binding flagellar brake protein YcgR